MKGSVQRFLFIFGTRPEAIKMAPLIHEFQKHPDKCVVTVCVTAQHRSMLDQVMSFFELRADHDLNIMKSNQSLFDVTALTLKGLENVLDSEKPDVVFVQGDTTSAFTGALAAFYRKVKVAHIEAGLRSGERYSPYPEEMNRSLVARLADYHFAPTLKAKENLGREGLSANVWVVGNSVVDALYLGLEKVRQDIDRHSLPLVGVDFSKKVLLVTGHRRESFGGGFEGICLALKQIAERFSDIEIVYPVHLNPNVQEPVRRILSQIPNVKLLEPLEYPALIYLLDRSYLVLTDSGGIQEEAPSLGKPVLVMRNVTEREEGIAAGAAILVGTETSSILENCSRLLTDSVSYERMAKSVNPYGDGQTARRIAGLLLGTDPIP